MPLNKEILVSAIVRAFDKQRKQADKVDVDAAINQISNDIASAVDAYIRSGDVTITVPAGQTVTVATAAGPATGTTTSTIVATNGKIN